MKLGLSVPVFTTDVGRPLGQARRAAGTGYDAVFAPDHVFPPGAPDRPSLDATSLLAAVGASGLGLRVGFLVTRPYLRPVGMLAKTVAGLAHLSGSPAIAGLGLGDANGRAEHAALGVPFPEIERRTLGLEETALALGSLFAGAPWPGGSEVAPVPGPLLPPGDAEVWIGGTSDRVLDVAARAANAWNGWGLDAEAFTARAARLAERVRRAGRDPVEVPPTWGGIVLVGEDGPALASLETERAARGLPMTIWRGTVDDLRSFRDQLAVAGCGWFVATVAGPADRLELLARTLTA